MRQAPSPPPCRVQYHGMLSSFSGPEDKFEEWKATRRQKLIFKLEPVAQMAIPVSIGLALLAPFFAEWMRWLRS